MMVQTAVVWFFTKKTMPTFFESSKTRETYHLASLLVQNNLASRLILSHIRSATTGAVELRNTHPFTREVHGRIHSFALIGNVPEVFELDLELDRFNPIGDTDGEYVFCWILDRINGLLDSSDWKRKACLLRQLGDHIAVNGPVSFLYSDSLRLYAFASRKQGSDVEYQPGLYYCLENLCLELKTSTKVGFYIKSSGNNNSQLMAVVSNECASKGDWIPFDENQLLVFESGEVKASY